MKNGNGKRKKNIRKRRNENTERTMKVIIDIDDRKLAGMEIKDGRKTVQFEDLPLQDEVSILNSLAQFCSLFMQVYRRKKNDEKGEGKTV